MKKLNHCTEIVQKTFAAKNHVIDHWRDTAATLLAVVEAVRKATDSVTTKTIGGGVETLCNAADFDPVSDAEARHVLLDVLRALQGAVREKI